MDMNQFVDRTQLGRFIRHSGFVVHAQAGAQTNGYDTVLLLLQGRQTHVKAVWAGFHEKRVQDYNRIAGSVYVQPNPTKVIPSGMETLLIHKDFVPGQTTKSGYFYTFGPPHFGLMLQSETSIPMLPHWETVLWQLGLYSGFIHELTSSWNVEVYQVNTDLSFWLDAMKKYHDKFPYEPETV